MSLEPAIAVIRKESLSRAHRLDSEHYQPHFLRVLEAVNKKKTKKLSSLVSKQITTGHTPSMENESFYGGDIKFIKTDNLRENQIVDDYTHKLSPEGFSKLKNAQLQDDDIVVTIIGATYEVVGRVARVFSDLGPAAINQNISLIRPTIPTGYLATFLMSKYGREQLYYLSRQTEQVNLNNKEVADVTVPLPNKSFVKIIDEIHTKSHYLMLKSVNLYNSAEASLLRHINLDDFVPSPENIAIKNILDCSDINRIDAEYWQPKFQEIDTRVAVVKQKPLGDIVDMHKGVEPGSEAYVDRGVPFIRVADFSTFGIEDVAQNISKELYERLKSKYTAKPGEVLFTKDGTIGISYAVEREIEGIFSSAFLRLDPLIDIKPNYLALVLNSTYCKSQIERMSGGAIISHLKPGDVAKINVPLLSKNVQGDLANQVSDALRYKNEAKSLVALIKRATEIYVEDDEKTAMKYILDSGLSIA